MKTAMITGCASGFGAALSARLLHSGYRVVATDPDLGALAPLAHDHALLLQLDVSDEAQVQHAVDQANAWSPVDILVNNGGYAVFGTQEEVPLDIVQQMFEVNVFGPARMTQALLPTLRERSGIVVQLSSVAGRAVFPESGWYAASKYAIEAMSEALVQECATFGVRVRLVEPGSFDTRFLATATQRSPTPPADSPYTPARELWNRRKSGVLSAPQSPSLVIDAIVDSLARDTAFERLVVGIDSERILTLREALGADAFSMLNIRRNGLQIAAAPHGHVLTPRQVLTIFAEPEPDLDRLEATLIAHHLGHLDHWPDSDEGTAALEQLNARFRRD